MDSRALGSRCCRLSLVRSGSGCFIFYIFSWVGYVYAHLASLFVLFFFF